MTAAAAASGLRVGLIAHVRARFGARAGRLLTAVVLVAGVVAASTLLG